MYFTLPILRPLWRHISLLNPFTYRHLIPYFHLALLNRFVLLCLLLTVLCPLSQAYLIFANRKDIRKLDENFLYQSKRLNTSIINDQLEDAVAIDFDYENQLIFWSDIGFETIRGLRLRDNHKFDVIVNGIFSPDGLACDWITKKIYWADSDSGRIEVALYNGSYQTVLFWENLDQPRAIVLVPSEGLIFWSDWGDMPKIERASMDGNNSTRQVIITENIIWPNGLTVDYEARRLYWTDGKVMQISSADYHGKNRLTISCGKVFHPFALTVHGNILFWTDWETKDIHACNKTSNVSTALNSPKLFTSSEDSLTPMGITVFDSSRQPRTFSPCTENNGNCSHLCLLSSVAPYYSCACSTGIKLKKDGKTCFTYPEKILLLARRTDLRRISLDTKDYTSVILPIKSIKHGTVLDYDPVEGRIYWADDELRVIKRAMLNGSHQETIISTEVHHPDGVAIDWVGRNIYWTDAGTDRIEVARLDGSSRTILFNEGIDQPRAIVVHPEQGLMFWSDWGNNAKIERASLDGSDRMVIVDTNLTWPNGLAIDYQLSRIYWGDAKRDTIEMAKFDGSERRQIWSDLNSHLFGLTVFDQWVYFSDWQRRSVERVHKLTGEDREIIIDQLPDLMGIKAVSYKLTKSASIENPCVINNGNCSHLCLYRIVNLNHERVCACPTAYELSADQQTCVVSKSYFLLLRKNDIQRIALESKKFDVVPIAGLVNPSSFDVNMPKNTVYWIDSKQRPTIYRSFINGSNTEPIVHLSIDSPQSVAIDWIANNLYWTDSELKRIEVSRLDGTFRRVLFHDSKKIPHSLAVDPISGFLFWSDFLSNGKIERSLLDGEKSHTIAENVGHATSLTLDYSEQRVYWITNSSMIMSCLYNGSSRIVLMHDSRSRPSSLVVYGNTLYFVDRTNQTLESLDKGNPDKREVVKKNELLSSTTDLFMYNLLYQKGWNFCTVNNGGCQHLCFAKPSKSKVADNVYCSCATHYRLVDERNCLPPETFLLFSHKNEITRFLFDSEQEKNDFQEVTLSISNSKHIKAMTYDQYDHSIYWIDGKNPQIKRVFLNGSGTEMIVQSVHSDLYDIVIDPYSRILFWTSSKTNSINATRLIGHPTAIGSIYHSNVDNPRLLAFHYRHNFLFWTNDLQSPQIERIELPNGMKTTVVAHDLHDVLSIAVDQELDILLWSDRLSNKIVYTDFDGKRQVTLFEERNILPIALTTLSKYLFWIEKDKKSIEKLPLDLNNGRNKQTIFSKLSSLTDIISVPLMKKNSSSLLCTNENGGCSHICMIIHGTNTTEAKCGCPKGLVLSKDEKNCIEPIKCEQKQFSCNNGINCIDAIFRCNGSPDCLDGSDELNCPKCGSNQFTCFKDIISHEELICLDNDRICDGRKDCLDGHDELCCSDKFLCNSRHCLTSDQLCDGKKDCIEGEDENMNICQSHTPSKTSLEATKSYTLYVVAALGIVFVLFVFYQCKRCLNGHNQKEVNDILMTEQRVNSTFSSGIRNNRSPHRRFYSKKPLLNEKNKLENCNTLTSTTTVSGLDTLPNETHLALDHTGSMGLPYGQHKPLQSNHAPSSSGSSAPVSYPCETINPPPSPATERSQSTYSTYSSSLFVTRSRPRNKNGVFNSSKPSGGNRRHKKSRWPKSSLRGPPPTPCGTDVYEDLEPTSVKYIFYDNAQTELDDFDYKPPPPTPRHYFSDPSCPPSPVTEHSFCNLNPPPPSPVQESD